LRWLYLSLAFIGAILPYSHFAPRVAEHGINAHLLWSELFSTRMGAFFGLDVLVSAVALIAFICHEAARLKWPIPWLATAATAFIGVSCGLPLFLYLRERRLGITA
jgi:hypothetical protein